MSTTISKLDDDGRVERSVTAEEIGTDAVCATCQGTGIDPDPADMDYAGLHPGNDKCPECEGAGRIEPWPADAEYPPAPPAGLSTPAIDHDKVTAAAEALHDGPFSMAQAAAVKALGTLPCA